MNNTLVWLLQFLLPHRYWYRKFYLWSRHWRGEEPDGVKWTKIISEKWTCEKCGISAVTDNETISWDVDLDVHHKYYYHNGESILWHEKLNDLQVLCRKCHQAEHET